MGPVSFFGAEAKNWPETAGPKSDAWRYRRAAVSGVWVMPRSLAIGTNSHFTAGPAFRAAWVSGARPGETAYTAMPEGSRRASAAAHQATMSFASAYARLGSYFTFGPLRSKASTAVMRLP